MTGTTVVFGATGFVGRGLLRDLLSAPDDPGPVAAVVRSEESGIRLRARLAAGGTPLDRLTVHVLDSRADEIALDPAGSVRQQTDARLLVALNRREQAEEARLAGSLRPGGSRGCAVAVRDAWQNSPKGFSFSGDGLNVELWQRAAIETIAPDDEPPATAETGQGWVSIRLPRLVHYASVKIAPSGPAPAR